MREHALSTLAVTVVPVSRPGIKAADNCGNSGSCSGGGGSCNGGGGGGCHT